MHPARIFARRRRGLVRVIDARIEPLAHDPRLDQPTTDERVDGAGLAVA
ncbi:MAG: hypothetical protein WC911_10875 [Thermoleophilia bacterium]